MVCAFLLGIGSTLLALSLAIKVRIQVAQLKRSSHEGRFFCMRVARDVRAKHSAMHACLPGVFVGKYTLLRYLQQTIVMPLGFVL